MTGVSHLLSRISGFFRSRHPWAVWLALALVWQGAIANPLPVGDLAVLVDPSGTETIDSVTSALASLRFTPVRGAFNAGYTRNVHWLRFTVRASSPGDWWLEVQPPFLDDLRLYEPVAEAPGSFNERRGGDRLPFSAREEPHRSFVFKLQMDDTLPHTLYLRLQTTSSSLVFLKLWNAGEFHGAANLEYGGLGIYYGILIFVLLFNLVLWAWLREELYAWFCLHVATSMLLTIAANGLVSQYIFPEHPAIANAWLGVAFAITLSAGAPFYRRMLKVERDQPWLFRLYRIQVILPLALLPVLLSDYYIEAARAMISLLLLMLILGLWLALRIWREGRREGVFIAAGNALALFGTLGMAVSLLGLYTNDFFMFHLRQISGLGNIIAMNFALAMRFRELRAAEFQALIRVQASEAIAEQARAAHREQGEFIAMLSHELKTPLAVVDVAVQALERLNRANDTEVSRRHGRIRRTVGRVNNLVEQFLAKERIDDEGLTIRRAPTDVAALLRRVAEESADAQRLRVTAPAVLTIAADPALLGVVVANLIDNALKYSPPETTVGVSLAPCGESARKGIEIVVADHGGGIPEALRERLFDRYVRGDNVGNIGGAGLGMYLVRRIAEMHGGTVELINRDGGAEFRVWLPGEIS
ncbi:MAG: sensor histidine kinase [Sulfuricella sp.]|nr:sensor histidine kinase [Sulfuricella sp.]